MKLLGLTGAMGSGKTTATRIISEHTNQPIVTLKLAQPLYDLQDLIYKAIEPIYPKPKDFIKDRKLLQLLGTDWGRNTIDPDLWVKLWKLRLAEYADKKVIVIVDDVRFDNEAQVIKDLGGKIIKIVSNRQNGTIDNGTGIKNHATEQGISKSLLDAEVPNSGTLEEFEQVLKYANQYLGVW